KSMHFFAKKGHLKKGARQRQMHLENIFHALAAYDAERPRVACHTAYGYKKMNFYYLFSRRRCA
ncbi:hypothetical protein, partial [Pseudomonas aeruginosa]|uniref:hypothetical protein n=1 Tax=Pseudomonas aeruginosa TaxID=287 RepID=UPI002AB3E824